MTTNDQGKFNPDTKPSFLTKKRWADVLPAKADMMQNMIANIVKANFKQTPHHGADTDMLLIRIGRTTNSFVQNRASRYITRPETHRSLQRA